MLPFITLPSDSSWYFYSPCEPSTLTHFSISILILVFQYIKVQEDDEDDEEDEEE